MTRDLRKSNRRTVAALAGVACCMVGLSFAAVPLYNLFCRVTGFAGVTARADAGPDTVLDQTIKIRFDASTMDMPWRFKPLQTEMEIRIGETGLAFYEATNPTDRAITGSASYNVAPYSTGAYFAKIACFCFTEQTLQPGESKVMPVTFYVDPEIVEDREASRVPAITLSYTFYETDESKDLAALDAERGASAAPVSTN